MRWTVTVAALTLLAGVACGTDNGSGGSQDRPGDASARAACGHFHNVAVDARDGVLTEDELREKLREVNDTAQASDVTPVRNAAREMFAAITSGTADEFDEAVRRMSSACDPYRGG